MEWIRENLFVIVVVAFFVLMHARMHGGHGSHSRGGHGQGGCGMHGGHGSPERRPDASGEHPHAGH